MQQRGPVSTRVDKTISLCTKRACAAAFVSFAGATDIPHPLSTPIRRVVRTARDSRAFNDIVAPPPSVPVACADSRADERKPSSQNTSKYGIC